MKNLFKFFAAAILVTILVLASIVGFMNYPLYTGIALGSSILIPLIIYKIRHMDKNGRDNFIFVGGLVTLVILAIGTFIGLVYVIFAGAKAIITVVAPENAVEYNEIAGKVIVMTVFAGFAIASIIFNMRNWIWECKKEAIRKNKKLMVVILKSAWEDSKIYIYAIGFVLLVFCLVLCGLEYFIL